MTFDQFIAKNAGKSIDFDLLSSSKSREMDDTVPSPIGKHKISEAIVSMIAIYVMNNIIFSKFSPKKFLIYFAVICSFVPRMMLSLVVAFDRAVTSLSAFVVVKCFAAVNTGKNALSKLVVALSSTETRLLRRRSLVTISALFADVFHTYNLTYNVLRCQYDIR